MALQHGSGAVAGRKAAHDRTILPLPEEVVAQIKSSTSIVSLHGVVLELLNNSLDARATSIDATVDFTLGGCTVEDNGLGIAPAEFREDGGLGKIYCTSKYLAEEPLLGRNGTFLASLAAMSLLTIVSRHHEHRSHNMVTFHHSKSIDRQLPTPPQYELHKKHGTRVIVRNLFGNLPVRVKQRAILKEKKAEYDRLWETLKRQITGLLLGWRGQTSLRVRNADGSTSFSLSNTSRRSDAAQPRSNGLNQTLQFLTQAEYISFDDWPCWIPTSASTSAVSIKGAISLDPAPSKRMQFLSFGIRPLFSESEHNELYDEVNRIFSQSGFGVVEDDGGIDESEKVRRQADKRFKSNGYTHRQLSSRKGVDRYPMFYLRITLKNNATSARLGEGYSGDDTNLQAVMEVLGAMIVQWLSVHHFRPRKPRTKQGTEGTLSMPTTEDNMKAATNLDSLVPPKDRTTHSQANPTNPRPDDYQGRKKKRSKPSTAGQVLDRTAYSPFTEWSRVKSGRPNFFDNLSTGIRPSKSSESRTPPSDSTKLSLSGAHPLTTEDFAKFDVQPLPAGSLGGVVDSSPPTDEPSCSEESDRDGTISWIDPSTQRSFLLNARTGCVLPGRPLRPLTDTSILARQSTLSDHNKSIRLPMKPAISDKASTQWLNGVLKTWDNPVFQTIEKGVRQLCYHEHHLHEHDRQQKTCWEPIVDELEQAFSGSSSSDIGKLSRTGLGSARILSQVDKKFILAKVQKTASNDGTAAEVLVLIDQHAADERVQVEALLSELCTPLPKTHAHAGYRSKLGHQSHVLTTTLEKPIQFSTSSEEQTLFNRHAASFAAWGILFDTESTNLTPARQSSILSVTTLPPVISERCKADPSVLITFLRSAVWEYADATITPLPVSDDTHSNDEPASWVRRLSTYPKGLVDLVNSRACRSAIMFNDELSLDQCEELVSKLSKCVFPFMCAHGRPSMVPLIDLGIVGDVAPVGMGIAGGLSEGGEEDARGDFVQAWKAWKSK